MLRISTRNRRDVRENDICPPRSSRDSSSSVSFRLQAGHNLISVAGSNSFPSHSHFVLLVSGSAAAGSVV